MSSPAAIASLRKIACMASRTVSLPRKAKDRLLIPPLIRAPGQRAFSRGSDCRKASAYSSCSTSPVATASTLGSRMMSSGAKPACPVSRS